MEATQTDLERTRHFIDTQVQKCADLFESANGRRPISIDELADWVFANEELVRAAERAGQPRRR